MFSSVEYSAESNDDSFETWPDGRETRLNDTPVTEIRDHPSTDKAPRHPQTDCHPSTRFDPNGL